MSSNNKAQKKVMSSIDVFGLDSFKALCRDIGIDSSLPIENITIDLRLDAVARINIDYMACKCGE